MAKFVFDLPIPCAPELSAAVANLWFVGGYDQTPVPCEVSLSPGRIVLQRNETESGCLCLTWPSAIPSVVTSSTLRPRNEPYRLLTELSRGSVNRIRNLSASFRSAGMPLPPEIKSDLRKVTADFGRIILCEDSASSDAMAANVIPSALGLAEKMIRCLGLSRLEQRLSTSGPLTTQFGRRLTAPLSPEEAKEYPALFNAVRIVPEWRFLESLETHFFWDPLDSLVQWACGTGVAVSMGPLVDLSVLPNWLDAWAGDIPNLAAFMADFVSTIVARYRGRVRSWNLFSGFNHTDKLALSEDDRIRLAARLLETAKEIDREATWSFGLRQPFGDYLASGHFNYTPLAFADTLLRSGYDLDAIELELMEGEEAGAPRDGLDHLQVIELYETLISQIDLTAQSPTMVRGKILHPPENILGPQSIRSVFLDGAPDTDHIRDVRKRWFR